MISTKGIVLICSIVLIWYQQQLLFLYDINNSVALISTKVSSNMIVIIWYQQKLLF